MSDSPFKLHKNANEKEGGALYRRQLLKLASILPVTGVIGPVYARNSVSKHSDVGAESPLQDPWLSLDAVQNHLFPASESGLSAKQFKALDYLQSKFERPLADHEEQQFLFQGVGWLNDLSISDYRRRFAALDYAEKEALLQKIVKSRAGENWLSLIIDNLIEALVTDPVYSGNPDGAGWKSVGQIPGFPRPQAQDRYYELGYQKRQRLYRQNDEKRLTKG
ncbi:gluconate 2-dehydrogenase subunit 3 family protein [Thiomicrorhabdus xiamenensis]|uniref:Gluconate 2-dehydrogenase subunit 3 family protein n=1 Tax=Thiomicrorhabdus xiamenensis TaxID=2739063 RepID=A0A7D4NPP3_9GAMM|nr:gluconate 2-dehydrogenase subunit 3 family protein [Thiomicrorhabdus xiamenensis]QKI88112.1 gluconate 2-dehydrogenase subunit 3 family protein [Thiomicrorhabdus xiamenensis]